MPCLQTLSCRTELGKMTKSCAKLYLTKIPTRIYSWAVVSIRELLEKQNKFLCIKPQGKTGVRNLKGCLNRTLRSGRVAVALVSCSVNRWSIRIQADLELIWLSKLHLRTRRSRWLPQLGNKNQVKLGINQTIIGPSTYFACTRRVERLK